jgi:hypothetical protein
MPTPVRRDPLLDELSGPPTPRKPVSSSPPAFPGDRHRTFEELCADTLAGAHELRAKALSREPSRVEQCNVQAREIYAEAVRISGGASSVSDDERCDESAVRRRVDNPKLYPNLAQCIAGLSPEALAFLGTKFVELGKQKKREREGGGRGY